VNRLRIAPIVEGHGEVAAIRILLERVWRELLGGDYLDVLRPIRWPRSKLVQDRELRRAVQLAWSKLHTGGVAGDPLMVLVLLDANTDPPCDLGPELLGYATEARSDADVACVLAKVEYETWFVAAAPSLGEFLNLPPEQRIPDKPEESGSGKGWIERYFKGVKYSETVDQPRMTAKMDLALCRARSPSFDKLCRELEKRLGE
jgi:hypothetical protein